MSGEKRIVRNDKTTIIPTPKDIGPKILGIGVHVVVESVIPIIKRTNIIFITTRYIDVITI